MKVGQEGRKGKKSLYIRAKVFHETWDGAQERNRGLQVGLTLTDKPAPKSTFIPAPKHLLG